MKASRVFVILNEVKDLFVCFSNRVHRYFGKPQYDRRKLLKLSTFLLLTSYFLLLQSCSKEKLDHVVEQAGVVDNGELSGVRIINASEYFNVIANGDTLTSYTPMISVQSPYPPFDGPWYRRSSPTWHFSEHGYLGKEWRVPKALFKDNGRADLFFQHVYGFPHATEYNVLNYKMGLTIQESDSPVDYFLGGNLYGEYFRVERDETPPSAPDNVKIRIINMYAYESVSLTYADGTSVSERTSNVAVGDFSSYIELPYGTYQFRVVGTSGWQLPGTDNSEYYMIDQQTASVVQSAGYDVPALLRYMVYAPIHTYSPSGVYTVLVYPFNFGSYYVGAYDASKFFSVGFKVIRDDIAEPNLTYSRIQAFNALPGNDLKLRFGATNLTDPIPYGEASAYSTVSVGQTSVELLNASGNVLTTISHSVEPNQNYTFYAFPDGEGNAKLTVLANDLNGNGVLMPYRQRFVNLCPDIPYATFTTNDGESLGEASAIANLRPGIASLEDPYISGNVHQAPYEILAYRSAPGVVPGTWADDIPVLTNRNFIAREALYARFGGNLPTHEPGYYTVALIGRTGDNVPLEHKAKMVVIKHNK